MSLHGPVIKNHPGWLPGWWHAFRSSKVNLNATAAEIGRHLFYQFFVPECTVMYLGCVYVSYFLKPPLALTARRILKREVSFKFTFISGVS